MRSLRQNLKLGLCRIDRAIARSIQLGRGLRFCCNDRTVKVIKLFTTWLTERLEKLTCISIIGLWALWENNALELKVQANGRNIAVQQLPTLLAVTCCAHLHTLLHVVARSLKLVKLLSQQLPTFLLFRDH